MNQVPILHRYENSNLIDLILKKRKDNQNEQKLRKRKDKCRNQIVNRCEVKQRTISQLFWAKTNQMLGQRLSVQISALADIMVQRFIAVLRKSPVIDARLHVLAVPYQRWPERHPEPERMNERISFCLCGASHLRLRLFSFLFSISYNLLANIQNLAQLDDSFLLLFLSLSVSLSALLIGICPRFSLTVPVCQSQSLALLWILPPAPNTPAGMTKSINNLQAAP